MSRPLLYLVVAATLSWHALSVVTEPWVTARSEHHARDFASYYYAAEVALRGGDPYDRNALSREASSDRSRKAVYPFFYPPAFLLLVAWVPAFDLVSAYRIWYWLDEAFLVAAALALWRWWRPLGGSVGAVLAVAVAVLTAIPNNHLMGQANLPVLLLVIAGLWAEDRGRPVLGGTLLGAACMMKMSPALFVAWWLLRRRWTAVVAASACAVVLEVASFALVGPAVQARFWLEVLPSFGSGDYNGLTVPISLFGNHSVPARFNAIFPGGDLLSPAARGLSAAFALGLVGGLAWAFRRAPSDALASAAQVSAVAVAMLLVPVYTYEHHLVFAIPAMVVCVLGVAAGRARYLAVPVGLAWAVLGFDSAALRQASGAFAAVPLVSELLQEAKFLGLLGLLVATVSIGRSRSV